MLEVSHVSKSFTGGKGVFDLTFKVEAGEVFGFLGPNGAGKSTTIRQIMGFMKPDQGTIRINGLDTWEKQGIIQHEVGYLPGEIAFFEGMTGMSFLQFMGRMQQLADTKKKDRLIERLQFDANTPIRKMSKGMKQKVGLVAAFMHSPKLIILDEPTSGLDPFMQKVFIELVLEEKDKGTTFLMSSHSFPEIEQTCDRAAIIRDGRLAAINNVHELQSMQRRVFDIVFQRSADAKQFAARSKLSLESCSGQRVRVYVQGNYDVLISEVAQYSILSLDIHTQSLEQIFMNYYEQKAAVQ